MSDNMRSTERAETRTVSIWTPGQTPLKIAGCHYRPGSSAPSLSRAVPADTPAKEPRLSRVRPDTAEKFPGVFFLPGAVPPCSLCRSFAFAFSRSLPSLSPQAWEPFPPLPPRARAANRPQPTVSPHVFTLGGADDPRDLSAYESEDNRARNVPAIERPR
jgi:hypothetical protein